MTDEMWHGWLRDWQLWERRASERGWTVTPLRIEPPADAARLSALEARSGLKVPEQLRDVLRGYAAAVHFGWSIPSHLLPLEGNQPQIPFGSGLYHRVFDVNFIEENALPNFQGWKRDLAERDLSEEENAPWMWDHQFPFATWGNGDMLTIDMSDDDPARQPVRYFSHELEGLHGLALAPDFLGFVQVWSALGCAGTEYASLMPFVSAIDETARTAYLTTENGGARRWFAFATRDVRDHGPDEPPPVVFATTAADEQLVRAARAGDRAGVAAALAAGAVVDCVLRPELLREAWLYGEDFMTAMSYAAVHDDLAMAQMLMDAAATINTRSLPTNAAVKFGTPQTLKWLLERGGRANGWEGQRYFPLADLFWTRANASEENRTRYLNAQRDNRFAPPGFDRTLLAPKPISEADFLAMLEALLAAGADPDAPWDNGMTMLMRAGPKAAAILLAHGANVHAADAHGAMAIHRTSNPETAKVLVAHGADVNALHDGDREQRPLHIALMNTFGTSTALVDTLLALGADPLLRDANGRSSLYWTGSLPLFRQMVGYGLDPMAPMPDGGTLIHALVERSSRITGERAGPLLEHFVEIGIDINGQDDAGRTVLHRLADQGAGTPLDVESAVAHGADPAIRDNTGRTAFDLVPNDAYHSAELKRLLSPPPR